jgi:hypothetical protein
MIKERLEKAGLNVVMDTLPDETSHHDVYLNSESITTSAAGGVTSTYSLMIMGSNRELAVKIAQRVAVALVDVLKFKTYTHDDGSVCLVTEITE